MLQWMGGSRRKVTTSRGSTQKRQRQYFEQRRRQLQQQTTGTDNYLEENICSTSNNERRSLDVLSLKTLSTVAQECNSRCLNGPEAVEVNVAGNKFEINASQPTILALSGKPGKDPMESVSKEETVCDPPCSNDKILKSSTANHDPWKNEITVLDILEDDHLKSNFRENSMHEDHVSFSVAGLGKVGIETPLNSPPHRMVPHGGFSCPNSSRDVEMSKNLLNDLELEVDAVLQDIDTSLTSKSSKFRSYASGQVEPFENEKPKMCFPDDMQFDKFDSRFRGAICGKRAHRVNEDYKKNRYFAHPNFIVDDFLYDTRHNLQWEDAPQKEYMTEDCWKSQNLLDESFKKPQFFCERDMEIPIDSFNLTESMAPVFPTFHASERNIYFEEDLLRNPAERKNIDSVDMALNPYRFHVEDPKDGLMSSSEESCSSSAVRKDIMDSVVKKSDSKTSDKISIPKGDVRHFPREETSCGHRNYEQQGKNGGEKADTVKFDTSSLLSDQPSNFTIDNNLKAKDGWFFAREKSQSDVDSCLTSFYKHSKMKLSAYGNEQRGEGSMSAFADSKLGDRPKLNVRNSRYAAHECSPFTPFITESHDSPWKADLSLNSDVKSMAANSFGVIKSPENYKLPLSMSGYARKDWELKSENHLADLLDCKPSKQKMDYFDMGVVQFGDEEEGCKSNNKNLQVPGQVESPEFGEVMELSSATNYEKSRISNNENEYQCEALGLHGNGSKEAETAVADPKEERTGVRKNIRSSLEGVLMRQSYVIQFMCVQQAASIEKAKEEI